MPEGSFFPELIAELESNKKKPKRSVFNCSTCGLDKNCHSPHMEPFGKNRLNIAIVAEAPGREEDKLGIPLVGKSGQFLSKHLKTLGVDMDTDCIKLNVVQCHPSGNRTPTKDEIKCCRPRLEKQLREIAPDLIIALGSSALQSILSDAPFTPNITQLQGHVVPSNLWNCWVCCSFHPAYFVRKNGKEGFMLTDALAAGIEKCLETPYTDQRLDENKYKLVEDIAEAYELLQKLSYSKKEVVFDFETNCLSPFDEGSKLLTVSFATDIDFGWCIPIEHRDSVWTKEELETVYTELAMFMRSDASKIIHNWQFENLWSIEKLNTAVNNVVCDTMVRQHLINNLQKVSLEFQSYVRYGALFKGKMNRGKIADLPLSIVAPYNVLDSRYALRLKQDQDKEMECLDR